MHPECLLVGILIGVFATLILRAALVYCADKVIQR